MARLPFHHLVSIIRFLAVGMVFCIMVGLMLVSVRGNLGNPGAQEFSSSHWTEDGPFELSPERGRFALAYSVIEDHSVFFSLPLAAFSQPDVGYIHWHFVSLFAPAVSYLAIPGYLIGRAFGASQVGSFVTIALFALANGCLIVGIIRKLGGGMWAGILGMITFLFATPAYAYAVTLYQHHVSTFLILAGIYLLMQPTTWLSMSALWTICAASIPVDYPNAFLMLPIAFAGLVKLIHTERTDDRVRIHIRTWTPLTFFAAIVPLALFLWFNLASYGNAFQLAGTVPTGRINQDMPVSTAPTAEKNAVSYFQARTLVNGLYILLISPDRGLVRFTPVILLGFVGIAFLLKKKNFEAVLITSIAAINIIFYGMYGDVWGGWAFGSRYLIPSYALLSIGVASVFSYAKRRWIWLMLFFPLFVYSTGVATAGALSSNANPPQVEVLALEKISGIEQKYTAARNLDFLKSDSKSFVYRTFLKSYLSSWQFYEGMVITITTLTAIVGIATIVEKRKNTI